VAKWQAFITDPEWLKVRAETESNGPIVANVANAILQPTRFRRFARTGARLHVLPARIEALDERRVRVGPEGDQDDQVVVRVAET